MLDNRVLFHVGSRPWTLAAVCMVLGVVLLVVGGSLLAALLVRHGDSRRLTGREASRVAFNADRLGGELRPIHGPATGVETRVSFSIGDLRRARESGDMLMFWAVPVMLTTWSAGFAFMSLAAAVWARAPVILAGLIVLVPMFLVGCFMPWAAIYTKLE
jgi:hypothetical protein